MPVNEELLYQRLGERIRARRDELKLSQGRLGSEVDMLRTSIANIEAGRQRPPLHVIYSLCNVLGLEISEVLPPMNEVVQSRAVPVRDLVRNKVGGGVKEVPPKAADFLQQLLQE